MSDSAIPPKRRTIIVDISDCGPEFMHLNRDGSLTWRPKFIPLDVPTIRPLGVNRISEDTERARRR